MQSFGHNVLWAELLQHDEEEGVAVFLAMLLIGWLVVGGRVYLEAA